MMLNACVLSSMIFLLLGSFPAPDISASDTVLENEFLRVQVISRGGRVAKFYDKQAQRELLASKPTVLSGGGKSREVLFNSIETLTANFQLQRLNAHTIQASCTFEHGPIAGMELIRVFRLDPGQMKLQIRELWRSQERPNQLLLNWHNNFSWLDGETRLYLPSQRGMVEVDRLAARMNKLNLIQDVAKNWAAAFDGERGVALRVNDMKAVSGLQAWATESQFTLEADFKEINLTPTAAMDEWELSGELLLLRGNGKLLDIAGNAVLTSDDEQYAICFLEDFGQGELVFNGERKKFVAAAGSVIKLPKDQSVTSIRISTNRGEVNFVVPTKPANDSPLLPMTKKPVRELPGVNGFYYYYPTLYLSSEVGTEISFALRGDFSKTRNFRFALILPEGVFFPGQQAIAKNKTALTIEGQPYYRYELPSPYKTTRTGSSSMVMQVLPSFQSGKKAYCQAVWDGGEQPLQELSLEKIPAFPELTAGLKHFRVGLSVRTPFIVWPPEYSRFGVNHIEIWSNRSADFFDAHQGNGFYEETIRQARETGLTSSIQLGDPFPYATHVARGKMLNGAGRLFHPQPSEEPLHLPDLLAVDHRGQTVPQICPSYRGRYFEKVFDVAKTALDYGFDEISYDDETWTNGRTICFCKRCLASFGKDVPDSDADDWWEFKTDQVADIYRQIREVLGEDKRMTVFLASSISEDHRYGAITQRLTDYRKIGRYVDEIWPMYYTTDSASVGGLARTGASLLAGQRAKLVMGLAPNRYYEYFRVHTGNFASLDAVSSQMLESCFEGAAGVVFWGSRSSFRGAHDYLQIAQAVKALQPVEEIIIKGQRVELQGSNPAVKVTAYRYSGQYAIFLRHYGREVVRTELPLPGRAIDTLTGEEVGNTFVFGERQTYVLFCPSGE